MIVLLEKLSTIVTGALKGANFGDPCCASGRLARNLDARFAFSRVALADAYPPASHVASLDASLEEDLRCWVEGSRVGWVVTSIPYLRVIGMNILGNLVGLWATNIVEGVIAKIQVEMLGPRKDGRASWLSAHPPTHIIFLAPVMYDKFSKPAPFMECWVVWHRCKQVRQQTLFWEV